MGCTCKAHNLRFEAPAIASVLHNYFTLRKSSMLQTWASIHTARQHFQDIFGLRGIYTQL